MKKNYILVFLAFVLFTSGTFAAHFSIATTGSDTYSPSSVNATVGDTITIAASATHPLVQVDQATWNANGATPMGGGWGTKTSAFTFTITTANNIYFVCANHVSSMGMKGMINVAGSGVAVISLPQTAQLFPTVSDGQLTLSGSDMKTNGAKLFVYNILGGTIVEKEIAFTSGEKINLDLADGTYFYRFFVNDKFTLAKQIIISK